MRLQDIPYTATHVVDSFSTLTPVQVEKTISAAQGKTCQLHPVPTWIVKEFRTRLSPFIARLFNESLAAGCFTQQYKHAIIAPLLKNISMNVSQLTASDLSQTYHFCRSCWKEQLILSCRHSLCQHQSV